ncbi:MAG: hypothetical protein JNL90_11150 [Planctomycetes bacterium]|nr:hypothetical protein [Planctomycetota bacterium]
MQRPRSRRLVTKRTADRGGARGPTPTRRRGPRIAAASPRVVRRRVDAAPLATDPVVEPAILWLAKERTMLASCLPILVSLLSPQGLPQYGQDTVVIDDSQRFQTWEGFGEAVAYQESSLNVLTSSERDEVRDLVFLRTGARRLRLNINPKLEPVDDGLGSATFDWSKFVYSTWYPEQLAAYKEARDRGIDFVWASCPTPPDWMKINPPLGGTLAYGGQIDPTKYDEFAEFIAAYVTALKHPHTCGNLNESIPLDAISIVNEPDFVSIQSPSTSISKQEYAKLVRIVKAKLDALELDVEILGPECSNVAKTVEYLQAIIDNQHPTPAVDALDGIITHQYGQAASSGPTPWAALNAMAIQIGKPLGQSEASYVNGTNDGIVEALGGVNGVGVSDWILAATNHSEACHWSYFNAWWEVNDPSAPENTGEGLVRIHRNPAAYVVPKRYRVFQHYAAHILPGAVRIAGSSSTGATGVSAWLRPVGGRKEYTIVLSNKGALDEQVALSLPAAPSGPITSYSTSATLNHVPGVIATPATGVFVLDLPKESIKTLVIPMGIAGHQGVEVQMTPGVLTAGDTFDLKLRYHASSTPPTVAVILARLDPDGQLWYHWGTNDSWTLDFRYHQYGVTLSDSTETVFTSQSATFFSEGRSAIYAAVVNLADNHFVGEPSWMDVIADL